MEVLAQSRGQTGQLTRVLTWEQRGHRTLSIKMRDGATNQAELFLPAAHPGLVNFKLVSHPRYLLELQNAAVLVEPGDDGHIDEWLGLCRFETRFQFEKCPMELNFQDLFNKQV